MSPELADVSARIKGVGTKAFEGSKKAPQLAKSFWQRIHTKAPVVPLIRYEEAIVAVRPSVQAKVLWTIMIGFSIDDLLVIRIPSAWLAIGLALLIATFGGLRAGRKLSLAKAYIKSDDDFNSMMRAKKRAGQLLLILTAIVFLLWLMLFSSGVPPWAV